MSLEKIDIFAEAELSACNAYIESVFSKEQYEDLAPSEQMRVNMVLIKTRKLSLKYEA